MVSIEMLRIHTLQGRIKREGSTLGGETPAACSCCCSCCSAAAAAAAVAIDGFVEKSAGLLGNVTLPKTDPKRGVNGSRGLSSFSLQISKHELKIITRNYAGTEK